MTGSIESSPNVPANDRRSAAFVLLASTWLVASFGMLASLYLCEVRGWTPCFLCWYQRICLWPLVLILGVACLRRRSDVVPFILPQVVIGLALAAYQVFIQEFVGRDFLGLCRAGPDCALKVNIGLGPISIPMLSLAAFALIIVSLTLCRQRIGQAMIVEVRSRQLALTVKGMNPTI